MKNREEYIDKLAAQLKDWSAKIDEMEVKARAMKEDAKVKYETQIRELKDQRDAAMRQLHELKGASGDAWDVVKTGVETAWSDLQKALTEAKQKFQKPGKPS
jgi:outer membrane murein-binding lipoprotein Lpp